ncbi:MAG: ABC transporter permease [Bacteroidota bacterium]
MLYNYFKIAFRNLLRHKAFSLINILGLAVGMACCLLIWLYVQHQLSYDRYHTQLDRIYRVLHGKRHADSAANQSSLSPEDYSVWGNAPVGPALASDFPEIKKMVQFTSPNNLLLQYGEKRFQEDNLVFMDSTVFNLFSWKLLDGNPTKALVAPRSIVLTHRLAQKYFGQGNALGKTIMINNQFPLVVTGVMEDVPSNSHFTFNGLISMSTMRQFDPEIFSAWGYVDFYTYFYLPEQTNLQALQAKMPAFLKRHQADPNYTVAFEPMTDAYLHSKAARQPGKMGSLTNLSIFSLVGIFILVIACINFINLSTARSAERAKEVGVRKVLGAHQSALIRQFLTESVLLAFLAAVFAWLLTQAALPFMESLAGVAFSSKVLFSWQLLLGLLATALVVGLLAGSFPAWVLSRFRPVQVLKGSMLPHFKGVTLRQGLVVFQFSLSIALITGMAIVFSQLTHLRSLNLGFQQEQMLVVDFGGDEGVKQKLESIKSVFEKNSAVVSASASRAVPGDFIPNAHTEIQTKEGAMKANAPLLYEIDVDFIPHYQIQLVAGRAYAREFPADTAKSLVINEAAAKLYGYANPQEVIGKRFSQWGREGTVIGVVKDFNFRSLHQQVEPLALRLEPRSSNCLSLLIKPGDMSTTLAQLERLWREVAPQRPFIYRFLDESFNRQYQADVHFGNVFGTFAGLAIFIACLGLYGLATFTAKQRTKEIGIRKVLGASVSSIVALLSQDFLKLVLVAILLATPLSYYAMIRWLEGFAYQVPIRASIFVWAGFSALLIALLTVSYQAIKAALANPVKSLRTE